MKLLTSYTLSPKHTAATTKAIALKILLYAALVLALPSTLSARTEDFSQPLEFKADRLENDEKAGLHRLMGNVRITQGSMQITADKITVTLKDNKASIVTGEGSPIVFKQENDAGELVQGECRRITYDAANGRLTLSGDATLTEPKQALRSDKIVFDSITQTVVAEGGDTGQVTITIQPPDQNILEGVTLSVQSGEVVGLLGPNGAGKTTCFYMVVGLVKPDSGKILFDEQEITRYPMHARARLGVGYLPQEASVFRQLSVERNIYAILEMRSELDTTASRDKLESLLEELQITHIRDSLGISLSGGERRRVEIARALAADPNFILLDEPFAGVDPISIIEIQRIVTHLKERGIGVLITDHNVRETLGICDRAYILSHGSVIKDGSPDSILADERVKEVYLGENFKI